MQEASGPQICTSKSSCCKWHHTILHPQQPEPELCISVLYSLPLPLIHSHWPGLTVMFVKGTLFMVCFCSTAVADMARFSGGDFPSRLNGLAWRLIGVSRPSPFSAWGVGGLLLVLWRGGSKVGRIMGPGVTTRGMGAPEGPRVMWGVWMMFPVGLAMIRPVEYADPVWRVPGGSPASAGWTTCTAVGPWESECCRPVAAAGFSVARINIGPSIRLLAVGGEVVNSLRSMSELILLSLLFPSIASLISWGCDSFSIAHS